MSRHTWKKTETRGLYRCACGAQCMVVVRMNGIVATLRAFNLYRYPLLTNATAKPGGLMRAKGWSAWSTLQPGHVTPRTRAMLRKRGR